MAVASVGLISSGSDARRAEPDMSQGGSRPSTRDRDRSCGSRARRPCPVRRRPVHAAEPPGRISAELTAIAEDEKNRELVVQIDARHRQVAAPKMDGNRRPCHVRSAVAPLFDADRTAGRPEYTAVVLQPGPSGGARRRWPAVVRDRQRHDGNESEGARDRPPAGPVRVEARHRDTTHLPSTGLHSAAEPRACSSITPPSST